MSQISPTRALESELEKRRTEWRDLTRQVNRKGKVNPSERSDVYDAVQRLYSDLGWKRPGHHRVPVRWFEFPCEFASMAQYLMEDSREESRIAEWVERCWRFRSMADKFFDPEPYTTKNPWAGFPMHEAIMNLMGVEKWERILKNLRESFPDVRLVDDEGDEVSEPFSHENFLRSILPSQFNCQWLLAADLTSCHSGIGPCRTLRHLITIVKFTCVILPFRNICIVLPPPSSNNVWQEGTHDGEFKTVTWKKSQHYSAPGMHETHSLFRDRVTPIFPSNDTTGPAFGLQIQRLGEAILQRRLIDWYGLDRFLEDCCRPYARDEYGELYFAPLAEGGEIQAVKVRNSTPEADGTRREYFIRVPNNIRTPREAIAWSFDLDNPEDYQPLIQT